MLHYHISRYRRAFATASRMASSFSASPSRLSAPMCSRMWTRDPSAPIVMPLNTGPRPSRTTIYCREYTRAVSLQTDAAATA